MTDHAAMAGRYIAAQRYNTASNILPAYIFCFKADTSFLLNTHIKKSEGKLLEYSAENIAKRQFIYMGAERTAKALERDSHNKYGKIIA